MAHRASVTLSSLPLELRQAILSHVDTPVALEAAVTAGKCLAEALQASGGSVIIVQVLQRVIPPPLIPEAVAILHARKAQDRDNDALVEFIDEYFDLLRDDRPNCCMTLSEALDANALQESVQQFTDDFVAQALSRHPVTDVPVQPSDIDPPGERELLRIQRAFYRFELYCSLLHRGPKKKPARLQRLGRAGLVLSRFSPWENEQLGCVYDFLYNQVAEPFNYVAAHDVEWGEIPIRHLGSDRADGDSWRDQYVRNTPMYKSFLFGSFREISNVRIPETQLAKGLAFINQLRATKTYSERCQILKPNLGTCPWFLHDGLLWLNSLKHSSMIDEYEMPLEEYDDERRKHLIPPPAVPDSDPGPEQVWNVVHQRMGRMCFIMSEHHINLRERGYVFWDQWRLENWGLLRTPWVRTSVGPPNPSQEAYAKMQRSQDRRTEIYLNGGRGWWSEEDESHIVYNKART